MGRYNVKMTAVTQESLISGNAKYYLVMETVNGRKVINVGKTTHDIVKGMLESGDEEQVGRVEELANEMMADPGVITMDESMVDAVGRMEAVKEDAGDDSKKPVRGRGHR